MLSKGFKSAKCKTSLNLAKSRTKLMKNKKEIHMRQLRRDVAQLLLNAQHQTARVRVEHVVREEKMLAAYEMIEIYCELIVARLPIIESQKNCPLDLKEAIASLIFAAPRCGGDIQELQDIRKHFTAKYGKDFVTAAVELHPACGVSRTMVEKLSVQAPDGPMKVKILKGIAEENNIHWEPNWFKDEDPVSSGDTPKNLHPENNNKIQMEPLNVPFADDLEEKHALATENMENSSQRHPRTNASKIPPSPSPLPEMRPSSGSVSDKLRSTENAVSRDRQQWKMEFKDATAAAQAAAESAERASMAARAAAELSIRDSNRRDPYAANALQHEQRNPSFNYKTRLREEGLQGSSSQRGDISEGCGDKSSKKEFSQSEVHYETRQHEFKGSESTSFLETADSVRQSRDFVSSPNSSGRDYNWSSSYNVQEFETEPTEIENPFHGKTVEPQNQPSKFYSQSSVFGNEYDAFSNLKHQSDEIYSDTSFGASGQGILELKNWQAKSSYPSEYNSFKDETVFEAFEERNVFGESDKKNYGTGVFSGMDQGPSGLDTDNDVGQIVANAVFDESGSDDDTSVSAEKFKSPSDKLHHVLHHNDNPYFDSDLSESFRNSPIYSKLNEPVPVTLDDDDLPSPNSEKELQTEIDNREIGSDNYRDPDWYSHVTIGYIRSSFMGKETDDSLVSSEQMEENQNLFVGSVEKDPLQSKDHSKFTDEIDTSSVGGMELNLEYLPGGRRNRPTLRAPYTRNGLSGVSSPSSKAVINNGFGENEDSSPTYKFQGSSSQVDIEHMSISHKAPKCDETVIPPTHSNLAEQSYIGGLHENMHETGAKDPTGCVEFDYSAPIEYVPSPVKTRKLQGAGVSRRTKGSRLSSHPDDAKNTDRVSSASYAAEESPRYETKTKYRSSGMIGQSSRNDDKTYELGSETKVSRHDSTASSANVENSATPKSADIPRATVSRENSGKNPSHVHPKLPDFEALTAHLQSLRTNRQ